MQLVEHGLYKVKDRYFTEFGNGYWVDNKQEGRPYYYLFQDTDGVDWVIPISSQVDNYKRKIAKEEKKRGVGKCIYYHIGLVASKERVFLIGDMFPIDERYIKAPYRIRDCHYVSKNKALNTALHRKATKNLLLVERGVTYSRNDIMGIKQKLISDRVAATK